MNEELKLQTVDEKIPKNIDNDTILNINTKSVNELTHGFHKYPGKYIPQIPNWAIRKYLNNNKINTIIDPFCGSGTTLIEGLIEGNNVIGIDIDPLSVFISKVKTTNIDTEKFAEISKWIIKEIKDNSVKGQFIPKIETLSHWFTQEAIEKLSKIRFLIDNIPVKFESNENIKNAFYVCFSSIIRRVSNADNQSQKTYVSHTKIKTPTEVYSLFFSQLKHYQERFSDFAIKTDKKFKSEVINTSSSEKISKILKDRTIDLAITSPPYIKAIDYIYNQMAELFWIGDLFEMETQSKQNILKNQYIGNKQIKKVEYSHYNPFDNKTNIHQLDRTLEQIFTLDKKNGQKHAYITRKYFAEMENHFVEMNKILKPRTHYIMVVGDSTVSDIYVDTANIISKIAEKKGFKLINKWGYKIKNRYMRFDRKGRGGIINIDWVLDFERIKK